MESMAAVACFRDNCRETAMQKTAKPRIGMIACFVPSTRKPATRSNKSDGQRRAGIVQYTVVNSRRSLENITCVAANLYRV